MVNPSSSGAPSNDYQFGEAQSSSSASSSTSARDQTVNHVANLSLSTVSDDNCAPEHSQASVLLDDAQETVIKTPRDLYKLYKLAFSEDCSRNWCDFTSLLGKSNDAQLRKRCFQLVVAIQKFDSDVSKNMTAMWLNLHFRRIWEHHDRYEGTERIEKTITQLETGLSHDQHTLKWVQERCQDLHDLQNQIKQWGSPTYTQHHIEKLRILFTKKLGFDPQAYPQPLQYRFARSGRLGRLALLEFIKSAVESYTCIFNEVVGSTEYQVSIKREDFGALLLGYRDMMQALMSMIDNHDEKRMMKPRMGSLVPFADYLRRLENGCQYKFGFEGTYVSPGLDLLLQYALGNVQVDDPENPSEQDGVDMSSQLVSRPEFLVDGLVIGSRADLNCSVHWPATLNEYFTLFHQNMKQVCGHLSIKEWSIFDVPSGQPRQIMKEIMRQFQQEATHMDANGSRIEVGFQIPVRQASCLLAMKFNVQSLEKGIDLEVRAFGDEESTHCWDQTATVGAFLSHFGGVTLKDGRRPMINYNGPVGAAFCLHLPHDYTAMSELIGTLHHFLKNKILGGAYYSIRFLLENYGTNVARKAGKAFSWHDVGPKCFESSLYLNTFLLDFFQDHDQEICMRVAKHSLIGLARYGLEDYTRLPRPYSPRESTRSLKEVAINTLVGGMTDGCPASRSAIEALRADPDVSRRDDILSHFLG